jgi:hypothetical protein
MSGVEPPESSAFTDAPCWISAAITGIRPAARTHTRSVEKNEERRTKLVGRRKSVLGTAFMSGVMPRV